MTDVNLIEVWRDAMNNAFALEEGYETAAEQWPKDHLSHKLFMADAHKAHVEAEHWRDKIVAATAKEPDPDTEATAAFELLVPVPPFPRPQTDRDRHATQGYKAPRGHGLA